jgi:hypothetical protein
MFTTTGRFKSIDKKLIDKNFDKNIDINIDKNIDIISINTDENTYSINRVEKLIDQKSNILHNHINQIIKPNSIETTEIIVDNINVKNEITANK